MHESKPLSLLTRPYIFYQIKNSFSEKLCYLGTPCRASGYLFLKSYPCYLCDTTSHSGHQAQHQCYLRDVMPRQWSPGDLLRVLRI